MPTPRPQIPNIGAYRRLHRKLRPDLRDEYDADTVKNCIAIVEDGSPSAARKALRRIVAELENARIGRDRGLSATVRRAVRRWELDYVDGIVPLPARVPPPCFGYKEELDEDTDMPSVSYLR